MRVSLIVTTYNRPEALLLVLESIRKQSIQPSEVIIADDGSEDTTKSLIDEFRKSTKLKIIHSYQEDLGFRVSESRNRAISIASSEYVVLIDGDMVLHSEFIHDHTINAQHGYFIQGSRVLISPNKTEEIIKTKEIAFHFLSYGIKNRFNAIHSNFLSKLFSNKRNYLKSIRACNMSFYRQDCIEINGFNNEFEGWGREDSEFITRLVNNGISRKTLRFNALQYHLWHTMSSKELLLKNNQLLKSTVENNLNYCENGINSFLEEV